MPSKAKTHPSPGFPERLRRGIDAKGISVLELARRTRDQDPRGEGVKDSTIGRWLSGFTDNPGIADVVLVATVLDMTLDELWSGIVPFHSSIVDEVVRSYPWPAGTAPLIGEIESALRREAFARRHDASLDLRDHLRTRIAEELAHRKGKREDPHVEPVNTDEESPEKKRDREARAKRAKKRSRKR